LTSVLMGPDWLLWWWGARMERRSRMVRCILKSCTQSCLVVFVVGSVRDEILFACMYGWEFWVCDTWALVPWDDTRSKGPFCGLVHPGPSASASSMEGVGYGSSSTTTTILLPLAHQQTNKAKCRNWINRAKFAIAGLFHAWMRVLSVWHERWLWRQHWDDDDNNNIWAWLDRHRTEKNN
jgi:hypothetical protein